MVLMSGVKYRSETFGKRRDGILNLKWPVEFKKNRHNGLNLCHLTSFSLNWGNVQMTLSPLAGSQSISLVGGTVTLGIAHGYCLVWDKLLLSMSV